MTQPVAITSAEDPRVAPYANLRDADLRRREFLGETPLFIAESELTVRQLLASRCEVASIFCTPEMFTKLAGDIAARSAPTPVYTAPLGLMEQIAGFQFHRGVLAAGVRPAQPALAPLLASSSSLCVLEGISNHDNVGSIFRNVGALGGEHPAILLGPGCCDPLYRKSLRVSIGHVLSIPWCSLDDRAWKALPEQLRAHGWASVALTPSQDSVSITKVPRSSGIKFALFLGAEGPGLTAGAMSRADVRVRIPMRTGVDSLNVGVAGAVAMSHLVGPA